MKSNIAGNITNISGLNHILSIGYEVECGVLMKLTETGDSVLFNSDTFPQDVLEFKKFEEDPEEIDEDMIERLEEMVEDDIYDDNGEIDTNSSFYITNDIALSPFMRELTAICRYSSEEDGEDHRSEKDNLYLFRDIEKKKDYDIHFLFKDANTDCATHSNVEWVFTYYKPQQSDNIIIHTFLNMIKNLLRHLSDLEPIVGNFIMKYKDEKGEDAELIVAKPEKRFLYHKPNTNLYYLLTQMYDSPFTIDDACSVFQMTFSSKCEHIMEVMISLLTDTLQSIPTFASYIDVKLDSLLSIKNCVDNLIDSYNNSDTEYKIDENVEIIKNYLCLIILKIKVYYEFKTAAKKPKYLKNLLFFNSRHSNYVLYSALKDHIEEMFGVDNSVAVDIIKKIVFQPEILNEFNSNDIKLRKGIFSLSNTLDKSNKNYGDPMYSLVSYFDFFEDPIGAKDTKDAKKDTNEDEDEEDDEDEIKHDWLEYKKFDDFSAKMELKDDIVLVECRIFQKILSTYVFSIADAELKEQMTNGSCNILTKNFSPDVTSLSIANLKKIVELHGDTNLGFGIKKTRRNMRRQNPNKRTRRKLNKRTRRKPNKKHNKKTQVLNKKIKMK